MLPGELEVSIVLFLILPRDCIWHEQSFSVNITIDMLAYS